MMSVCSRSPLKSCAQGQRHRGARNSLWSRSSSSSSSSSSRRSLTACAAMKVTLLPGDGIGPEIMDVAVDVLNTIATKHDLTFDFTTKLVGGAAIDEHGCPLPDDTLDSCKASDSVLLAAIGGYKWDSLPSNDKPERGLLNLRAGLGAFANLRPAVVLPQLADASTLKPEVVSGVDIMVVRELTGGIYFGEPKGFGVSDKPGMEGSRTGYNTDVYCEKEIERLARVGYAVARKRGSKVCSVDKANVLEVSQLWREVAQRVRDEEFPDIELSHMYVDNAAMQLVRNPKQFDTMITGNIFGDILSDEASMICGSIGMLPSASIGEDGPGLFEPIHGSAPDIAGQDISNPLAMILSAAMMLRYDLNQEAAADQIEKAVEKTLDDGYRTVDLMSEGMKQVGCREMGDMVLERL
ncbi:hypothetical protein PPROV_000292400 [Pycnococcus provasolii]|uniref:3-isopropylmalate dehydrogenase n=1 Tax=Pycnococcus provasolii TaxID=41880 RepID=A0A830HED8_9CHLO|nr:hypothetical protein PPROV_000292400 [Pycnococcus provasolii]